MEKQRLDKIIASTGRFSRREVKLLVRQGRVLVDGVPARSAEDRMAPETAEITVDGERLAWRRYTWLMMNKPAGVLSATEDGRGKTVLDLLPEELRRRELFPVGRLDKDTENSSRRRSSSGGGSCSRWGGWTRTPRDCCC